MYALDTRLNFTFEWLIPHRPGRTRPDWREKGPISERKRIECRRVDLSKESLKREVLREKAPEAATRLCIPALWPANQDRGTIPKLLAHSQAQLLRRCLVFLIRRHF
jgi:hypothetical protein